MALKEEIEQVETLLKYTGLNEYQASALAYLILVGETKATTLSKNSGVPSARIYGVLDELAKMGLVTIRPGRPTLYEPRSPEEIGSFLLSFNMDQMRKKISILETHAKDFVDICKKVYLKGKRGSSTVPLLRIVSVGETSLKETKELYDKAEEEILILSKAMEYLPTVLENLERALARKVSVRIILMRSDLLKPDERERQTNVIELIRGKLGKSVDLRFAREVPIRGCIVDHGKRGRALFLVEDPGVPYFLREAAVTSHSSVVNGLALTFNLMWQHMATVGNT